MSIKCYRCEATVSPQASCNCLDNICLVHGDCREVLPTLEPGCVDLVLTDPPYGISHPCDYQARGRDGLTQCRDYPDILGDNEPFEPSPLLKISPCILWGANHYASRLPDSSGWLVWDKERPDDLDQSTCELAWTNVIKGVRRLRFQWHGCMRKGKESLFHPMQKPVELMAWCLKTRWTEDASMILDPYTGSGPVLVAAKQLGRRALGVEIEEKYVKIACQRLRQGVLQFTE